MEDISLHILDIVENSMDAGATEIEIYINEDMEGNLLKLEIKDNGRGMNGETARKITDPFYTTKKVRRIGLGIPMLAQSAREANGSIEIDSKPGEGTTIKANFVYDHIDRRPFGNLPETIINLIAGRGEDIDIIYEHCKNENCFIFNSKEVKEELQDVAINHPEVLRYLRNEIKKGLEKLRK